jgi:hypothetical protein
LEDDALIDLDAVPDLDMAEINLVTPSFHDDALFYYSVVSLVIGLFFLVFTKKSLAVLGLQPKNALKNALKNAMIEMRASYGGAIIGLSLLALIANQKIFYQMLANGWGIVAILLLVNVACIKQNFIVGLFGLSFAWLSFDKWGWFDFSLVLEAWSFYSSNPAPFFKATNIFLYISLLVPTLFIGLAIVLPNGLLGLINLEICKQNQNKFIQWLSGLSTLSPTIAFYASILFCCFAYSHELKSAQFKIFAALLIMWLFTAISRLIAMVVGRTWNRFQIASLCFEFLMSLLAIGAISYPLGVFWG